MARVLQHLAWPARPKMRLSEWVRLSRHVKRRSGPESIAARLERVPVALCRMSILPSKPDAFYRRAAIPDTCCAGYSPRHVCAPGRKGQARIAGVSRLTLNGSWAGAGKAGCNIRVTADIPRECRIYTKRTGTASRRRIQVGADDRTRSGIRADPVIKRAERVPCHPEASVVVIESGTA